MQYLGKKDFQMATKGTTIWFWGGWGGGAAGTFCRDRLFIFITGSAGKFISG